jgi:hypothetical protein
VDALYWSFVTATTVGYGDLSLTTRDSRIFSIFYIIVSTSVREERRGKGRKEKGRKEKRREERRREERRRKSKRLLVSFTVTTSFFHLIVHHIRCTHAFALY